jgi:hypothetical protein
MQAFTRIFKLPFELCRLLGKLVFLKLQIQVGLYKLCAFCVEVGRAARHTPANML